MPHITRNVLGIHVTILAGALNATVLVWHTKLVSLKYISDIHIYFSFYLLISQLSPKNPAWQVQLYPPGYLEHVPLLQQGELVQLSTKKRNRQSFSVKSEQNEAAQAHDVIT